MIKKRIKSKQKKETRRSRKRVEKYYGDGRGLILNKLDLESDKKPETYIWDISQSEGWVDPLHPPIGTQFGYWTVISFLTEGGTFGVLYVVRNEEDGNEYVLKIFKFPESENTSFLREVMMYMAVNSIYPEDNIVEINSLIYLKHGDLTYGSIIMEKMNSNVHSLLDYYLSTYKKDMSDKQLYNYARSLYMILFKSTAVLCEEVQLMHENNMYHLDIKFDNMLYKQLPDGSIKYALADFGSACYNTVNSMIKCKSSGTYPPPEWKSKRSLYGHEMPVSDSEELRKADIYMIGFTINQHLNIITELFKGRTFPYFFNQYLTQIADVSRRMISLDPVNRPEIVELLQVLRLGYGAAKVLPDFT